MKFARNDCLTPADAARLIKFLSAEFPTAKSAAIELRREADPETPNAAFMTGYSYYLGGWDRRLNQEHFVQLFCPGRRPYPVRQQNPAGDMALPFVILYSEVEELVLVLAHELAHLEQHQAAVAAGKDPLEVAVDADDTYEVAAEIRAIAVLNKWLSKRRKAISSL